MQQTAPARMASVRGIALRVLLAVGVVAVGGCTQKDAYVPPDLFYLFTSYAVGKNPTSVTTADFNQDGFTDLITTNIGNNSLSVLFGIGDGTFREPVTLNVGKEPRALALNDFNGDGYVDVAGACPGSRPVPLLPGLADGTFGVEPRHTIHRAPVSNVSCGLNSE